MSTFFHSAAMSLLSRTLQTLLSKYLSDVDVEGVALPSFSDAGWGVRLSNVKLREGTKLMDLPNRQPRTVRHKRPHRNENNSNKPQQRQQARNEQEDEYSSSSNSSSSHEEEGDETGDSTAKSAFQEQNAASSSSAIKSSEQQTVATENDTDSETIVTAADPPSQQPKKRGWFSSWYYGSITVASSSETNHPPLVEDEEGLEEEEEDSARSSTSFHEESARNSANGSTANNNSANVTISKHDVLREACMPPSTGDAHEEDDDDDGESDAALDPLVGDVNAKSSQDSVFRATPQNSSPLKRSVSDIGESDRSENEEEEDGPPFILRLGEGGTIGTLDVRLVGKTIHLLVEDAVLTVEAVRVAPQTSPGGEHTADSADSNTTTADAPSKPKPKMPDPKTTGDRVLAENTIARIFSVIPNLFMRDIRVRVVIRDEIIEEPENGESDDFRYGPNDTVIELSIELLSVTEGGDFLLNFVNSGEDDEDYYSGDESVGAATDVSSAPSSAPDESNEFMTKRIRTGRGPEGGIVLKIFDAGEDVFVPISPLLNPVDTWARDSWHASTEFVVLRCSGLDLLARIFLGTKKEIAISKNEWYSDESAYDYDDFTVDALLFGGVDHIAPGPQRPLPAITKTQVSSLPIEETWTNPSATTFMTGKSGIQSCGLPSPFHKVARGMYPKHCSGSHLPCECCDHCWTTDFGSARPHKLDKSTPLPGLVFQLSVRDPMEVNVDRHNLEVLGMLISLFSKPQRTNPSDNPSGLDNEEEMDEKDETPVEIPAGSIRSVRSDVSKTGSVTSVASDVSRRSSVLDGANRTLRRAGSNRSVVSNEKAPSSLRSSSFQVKQTRTYADFDTSSSFPTYMQPEKIQILGIHLSQLKLRLHAMTDSGDDDDGASFCYWDFLGTCVTMDYHRLGASERPFQDVRLDVGNVKLMEYKGNERKQLSSLGVRQRVVDFDDMTVETFMNAEKNHRRPPWPTTAAAMLDVPPPLESLVFEERDRHGFQVRFTTVLDPGKETDRSRKDCNMRIGAAIVDVPFGVWNDFFRIIRLSKESILGPPAPSAPPVPSSAVEFQPKSMDSILRYKITAQGGTMQLSPLIKAKIPLTSVDGEISNEAGFSVQGFLEKIKVGFGSPAPPRVLDKGLSLHQLAKLPDNVRLRVLLFLKDLKPLETALGLPGASNSFLRCRSVNKGIVKVSKKLRREMADDEVNQNNNNNNSSVSKRQVLMSELLALDDDTLEALLEEHYRRQRRNSGRY